MIINIPIEVPEAITTMNWIELYAQTYTNWSPTILVTDDAGIVDEIDNPVSALEASITFNQKRILEDFRQIMLQLGREQGEKQAIETFNSLFQ